MSMVGYILGLGDRHPSNLMLDRFTGKIIHIDFGDCFGQSSCYIYACVRVCVFVCVCVCQMGVPRCAAAEYARIWGTGSDTEVAMHRDKFPEKIPFRLTRMLVNAMEVNGIEGNYRLTCESVMRVLRAHKDSLMAVLEAFVYDPLINWRLIEGATQQMKKNPTATKAKQTSGTTPHDADGIASVPYRNSVQSAAMDGPPDDDRARASASGSAV